MKCCTHYSLRHPCIVPANLTLHSLTSAKQTGGCVIGHRLVLTERIRRSYFSHDDFLAARGAAIIIESEGVMQVSVITAQKHPLPAWNPAWNRAHREARQQQSQIRSPTTMCCCYKRQLGTRVLNTEKETLPREAQSWLINCGQTLRGCGVHRPRRPIQPRAIRGTRGSAQTTEARSQI